MGFCIQLMLVLWLFGCTEDMEARQADESSSEPKLARRIPLPGVAGPVSSSGVRGRIDHLGYDPRTHYLYVAATENGSVEVLDLDKGERMKSLTGLKRPKSIAPVAATGQVVVVCGGEGAIRAYDAKTLEPQASASVGENADNVRVDDQANRLYVSCSGEADSALVILDAKTLERVGKITLPARPASFQLEPAGHRIFVNLPGSRQGEADGLIGVANRKSAKLETTWKLEHLARNAPMACDPKHKRLYVACRKPPVLIAVDMTSGKVTAKTECVPESDDLFFDPQTNRVVVIGAAARATSSTQPASDQAGAQSGEEGAVDLFQVGDQGQLTRLGRARSAPHARTGFLVSERHCVYVAVPPREGHDAEIWEFRLPE